MKTEKNNDIDSLITQYLSGKLDKEAFAQLKDWASESEENRIYVKNKVEIWFSSCIADETCVFDKDKAFELFQKRINKAKCSDEQMRRLSWKTWVRVAAVILIMLLPFAGYWQGKESVKQTFADIVVEAPLGARTKLYLPDGTLVWLNAGSKIVYSQGFGVDDRRLKMEGEGYFEVTRNPDIPFEVKTKEVYLKVLGTKFNFRNYPDDDEAIVNLMEGKVALHNEIKSMPELYLKPDEKVVMNKVTGEMKKTSTKAKRSNTWINDELFFDELPLKHIAKRLMRSYGVEIIVADSLQDKRFYGVFKVQGNTIKDVLDAMASTNQMKYRYENGKYILYR